ncbi:MAG TPA: DUF3592 domain-containing protein [Ktedonobacteraceae bacterium]|nr:DUF3592 domain-containing protein [Ktedonobacteraceae bacterium]
MQDDMYEVAVLQVETSPRRRGPGRFSLLVSYIARIVFFWWLVGVVDFLFVLFLFIFPIGSSWLVLSNLAFIKRATADAQGVVSNSAMETYDSNSTTNFVCQEDITFRSSSGQLVRFQSSDCTDNGDVVSVAYNPQHPQDAETSDRVYKSFVVGGLGIILGILGFVIMVPILPTVPRRLLQAYRGFVLRL